MTPLEKAMHKPAFALYESRAGGDNPYSITLDDDSEASESPDFWFRCREDAEIAVKVANFAFREGVRTLARLGATP